MTIITATAVTIPPMMPKTSRVWVSFVGFLGSGIRPVLMTVAYGVVLGGVVEGVTILMDDVFAVTLRSMSLTDLICTGCVAVFPLLDLLRGFLVLRLCLAVGSYFSSRLPAI